MYALRSLSLSTKGPKISNISSYISKRPFLRQFSNNKILLMDDYEKKIFDILKNKFEPVNLEVKDVSGGCGSMFSIVVESGKFKGLPMIKQHRLVNEVLKDEISQWHGLQLKTKAVK